MPAKQQIAVDEVPNDDVLAQAAIASQTALEDLDLEQMISDRVASALEKLIPSLVSAISQTQVNANPNGPSLPVVVHQPAKQEEAKYLKHYRLDGTVDAKFQKINFLEMQLDGASDPWERDRNVDPGDPREFPYVMKGQWINVKGDHYFATDENEVLQIEWMIANGYRFYEDTGGTEFRCPVVNCNKNFANYEVLQAHMKATHGVGN